MTGNPSWSVLDLDDEHLGDECVDIVAKVGVTWINSRLDFYEDSIEKLFRPTGELLDEAPTRVAQMQAEALLEWMAHEDIEHIHEGTVRAARANPGGIRARQQPGLLAGYFLMPLAILGGPDAN